jgi:hypothetical protein
MTEVIIEGFQVAQTEPSPAQTSTITGKGFAPIRVGGIHPQDKLRETLPFRSDRSFTPVRMIGTRCGHDSRRFDYSDSKVSIRRHESLRSGSDAVTIHADAASKRVTRVSDH